MLRNILSVLVGIIVASVTILLVEKISLLVYPIPPGLDVTNIELLKVLMRFIPDGVFLFIALSWLLGAFMGSFTACKVAHNSSRYGYLTGGIVLVFVVLTMFVFPYPVWFYVLGIAVFILGTWLGVKLGAKMA